MLGGASAIAAPGVTSFFRSTPKVEYEIDRSRSLWTDTAPEAPKFPTLHSSSKFDVTIIGGGYTGLSCAYYLKKLKPQLSVAVLESHTFASGASSRNSGAVSVNTPGVSDKDFSERGFALFRQFIDSQGIDCDFKPTPTLMMLGSKAELNDARPNLVGSERLVRREELVDSTNTEYYAGAIEKTGYFTLQPAKLALGLLQSAAKLGVQLFERSAALGVDFERKRVRVLDGEIESQHIVIATNAYTPRLDIVRSLVFPIHHYTVATRSLNPSELANLGLDTWQLRFENKLIACTFGLTPTKNLFMRLPLNYVSSNSELWADIDSAHALAERVCKIHYPSLSSVNFEHGWHGVTGHTAALKPVFKTVQGTIHIAVALNGLGIMPAHNFGFLVANRIAQVDNSDISLLEKASTAIPFPTEFYRSLLLKPAISMLNGNL